MAFDREHLDEDERRCDAKRAKMLSCMSNSKWRKVFASIDEAELRLPVCDWHFIRDDRWFRWVTPALDDTNEIGTLDHPPIQPSLFKDIVCLRWPRTYEVSRGVGLEPWHRSQDVDSLAKLLSRLGRFEYELGEDALTLYGYRERTNEAEQGAADQLPAR